MLETFPSFEEYSKDYGAVYFAFSPSQQDNKDDFAFADV